MAAWGRWSKGSNVEIDLPHGGEFLVLSGGFDENGDKLCKHSWLRLPQGSVLRAFAREDSKVWMKLGHLPFATAPAV